MEETGRLTFTKMHGCGNDYVYIDGSREHIPQEEKPALVRRLSDRHFGIGGDGVIFINPAPEGDADVDFEMEMYNADGTRAEMCGNGIRCVGAYVYEHALTDQTALTIVSAGAKKRLTLDAKASGGTRAVRSVTVDMGAPILAPAEIPLRPELLPAATETVQGMCTAVFPGMNTPDGAPLLPEGCRVCFVSMGNPHAVVILPDSADLSRFPLAAVGPQFENHPAFPRRINTEFVRIDSRAEVHMRVWERGTGETLACGTGCCAVAVACALNGLTDDEITVHVLGGDIRCRFERAAGQVFMTGPAATVFEGTVRW